MRESNTKIYNYDQLPKKFKQMTQIEITVNNKLIAEFMGYQECPQKLYRMGDDFNSVIIYSEYQDQDEYLTIEAGKRQLKFNSDEMLFNSSWDWLMPVIKKIQSIACEKMTFSEYDDYRIQWRMIERPSSYEIEHVFNQVAEFIKWFNDLNNSIGAFDENGDLINN